MKSIKVGAPIIVAWVVAVVGLALAHSQDSSTGYAVASGVSTQRSPAADDAEAQVAGTDLSGRMEEALGDAFGGVWFEPSTAQLHVGVTSEEAESVVEAVAAGVDLSAIVTPVPVESSWAELKAERDRLSARLSDLFKQGQVITGLRPQENLVFVSLGSEVEASRLAAVRDAATGADATVSIEVTRDRDLRLTPNARCKEFQEAIADCDPTLVAGVTIEPGKTSATCTAGPTVIREKPDTKAKATETFMLTAGHCLHEYGGAPGEKWSAFTHTPKQASEKKEIGEAVTLLFGEVDLGVVEVNTSFWARPKNVVPVTAHVALWNAKEETEPLAVEGQADPVVGMEPCVAGQMSGTVCGKVVATGVTGEYESGVKVKELARVQLPGALLKGGDSGGPWFSQAEPTTVHGIHVASAAIDGKNYGYIQPLSFSLEKLLAEKGLSLELLTEKNERRHGELKAPKYPVTLHGGVSGGTEKFLIEGGAVECKKTSHHTVISEATSTWTDTAKFENCTMFGFEGATVNMEGCYFENHAVARTSADNYKAEVDVVCPEGKSIKMAAGTCKAEIKGQTGLETMDLIDDTSASPKKDITLRPTVGGIAYTVTEDGCVCKFNGTGSKTGGEYVSTENITVTGQSTTTPSEKIDIEVAGE